MKSFPVMLISFCLFACSCGSRQERRNLAAIADLKNPSPKVRRDAANCLAGYGKKAASTVDALLTAADDEDWTVRQSAVQALAKIGVRGDEVVPVILRHVDDPEWSLAQSALYSLAGFPEQGRIIVPVLIDRIKNKSLVNTNLLPSAVGVLGSFPAQSDAIVPLLMDLIAEEKDEEIRLSAIAAAGVSKDKAAETVPVLRELLADSKNSNDMRVAALHSIFALAPEGFRKFPEILQLVTHDDERLRSVAYYVLENDFGKNSPILLQMEHWQKWGQLYAAYRLTGWIEFENGCLALSEKMDRKEALKFFKQVHERYPKCHYAERAGELADALGRMVEEDAAWKEPLLLAGKTETEKIEYWIYHLRDINRQQGGQPGWCVLLEKENQFASGDATAAWKLVEIGAAAVPRMIELLDDRRPICSVGFWRDFAPDRFVLRYQDAAIEILGQIAKKGFYGRPTTSSYLSRETPECRQKIVDAVKVWWSEAQAE